MKENSENEISNQNHCVKCCSLALENRQLRRQVCFISSHPVLT